MHNFLESYQRGSCREVYDELLALKGKVFEDAVYDDALEVAREMMRRVRFNLEEIVIPRLKQMGYRFGDGAWDHEGNLADEELLQIQRDEPIFQPPTENAADLVAELEQIVGSFPLTLRCWYEEVGTINLIGAFPLSCTPKVKKDTEKPGYGLDPLHNQPLVSVLDEMKFEEIGNVEEQASRMVPFSPDGDFKYGYSGGGDYEFEVPCRAFDGMLLGEEHEMMFVDYLRFCFRWGGFPGLEIDGILSQEDIDFLTKDLLVF